MLKVRKVSQLWRTQDIPDDLANVVNIMIMRKETFSIHAENEMARDQLMKDLLDCIEFAATGKYSSRTLLVSGLKLIISST